MIDETGRCRGCVGQDLVTMEIRAFPADALVMASGGCGAIFGRSTNSVACNGAAVSRVYQAGGRLGNAEFIQVHPTAIPGADKLRLISESARGEGGRVWVPRKPQDPRRRSDIPEKERYYFLEERYPKYGNLVPRDIGTREIFKVCMQEGLSVQAGRMCVYLDVTHLPRELLDRKLAGILEIYEKFQGADPRKVPMKIFPAVHYTMGGLWVDYEANGRGRPEHRLAAEPADEHPGPVCHRRVRVPVPRRQPPRRQLAGGLHLQRPDGGPGHRQLREQLQRPEVRRTALRPIRSGPAEAPGVLRLAAEASAGRAQSV